MENNITKKNMKTIEEITFNNLLKKLGIDPMEIEVVDPEIVQNDEAKFRDWFFRMGGFMNFTELQIATGWQNHLKKL